MAGYGPERVKTTPSRSQQASRKIPNLKMEELALCTQSFHIKARVGKRTRRHSLIACANEER